jgi:hypothetical protein
MAHELAQSAGGERVEKDRNKEDIIKVYRVAWPNAPRSSDGGINAKL